MNAVRIEEPCHEKWNEMIPTQRGAFCQKCAKDVYDFSARDLNQIKEILHSNLGQQLCGRFSPIQLQELSADFDAWKRNQPLQFRSRFVLALLLVFGLGLFSCSDDETKKFTEQNLPAIKTALAFSEQQRAELLFLHQDAFITQEMVTLGNTVKETWGNNPLIVDYVEQTESIPYQTMDLVAGGISIDREYTNYLEETVETIPTPLLAESEVNGTIPFTTKIYPNPTQNVSNLSLSCQQTARFNIDLYAMNGKQIQSIYSGNLTEGQHLFNLELTDLESGIYFVRVRSEKQEETIKIVKSN